MPSALCNPLAPAMSLPSGPGRWRIPLGGKLDGGGWCLQCSHHPPCGFQNFLPVSLSVGEGACLHLVHRDLDLCPLHTFCAGNVIGAGWFSSASLSPTNPIGFLISSVGPPTLKNVFAECTICTSGLLGVMKPSTLNLSIPSRSPLKSVSRSLLPATSSCQSNSALYASGVNSCACCFSRASSPILSVVRAPLASFTDCWALFCCLPGAEAGVRTLLLFAVLGTLLLCCCRWGLLRPQIWVAY